MQRHHRLFATVTFGFLGLINAFAQNLGVIDSLENKLENVSSKIDSVRILNELASIYSDSDSARTYRYATIAQRLAKSEGFGEELADTKYYLGSAEKA